MSQRRKREVVESDIAHSSARKFEEEIPGFQRAYQELKSYMADYLHKLKKQSRGGPYFLYIQAADGVAGTPRIIIFFAYNSQKVLIDAIKVTESTGEADPFST